MSGFKFCRECGEQLKGDEQFCTKCGASTKKADKSLAWDYDIRMSNWFFLQDIVKGLGLAILLVWLFLVVLVTIHNIDDGWREVVKNSTFTIYVMMFMVALFGLSTLIAFAMYGFKYEAHFVVDKKGAFFSTRKKQFKKSSALNQLLILAGILSGKPGMVGTGMVAQSMQFVGIPWKDVYRVIPYPERKVITLRNSWRKVMVIYCKPENYDAVLKIAQEGLERTAGSREASSGERGKWIMSPVLRWIAVALVSTVLASASPLLDGVLPVWILFAVVLMSSITEGNVQRGMGVLSLFTWLGVVIIMISGGFYVYTSPLGYTRFTRFSTLFYSDTAVLFLMSVAGMLGLLVCIWRSINGGALTRKANKESGQ